MIKTLEIRNFKSLKNVRLDLGNLNVFLGPNAAGKSNILDALKLLRDIHRFGNVGRAVRKNGGPEVVRCMLGKGGGQVRFEVHVELPKGWVAVRGKAIQPVRLRYVLAFKPALNGPCRIEEENLEWCYLRKRPAKKGNRDERPLRLVFRRSREQVEIAGDSFLRTKRDTVPVLEEQRETPYFSQVFYPPAVALLGDYFRQIRVYRIDPSAARAERIFQPGEGLQYLAEDGANLAPILLKLKTERGGIAQGLVDFMRCSVPEFRNWHAEAVQTIAGKSVSFSIEEDSGIRLSAESLSDGTVRLLCYFLALTYSASPASVICFEEPETSVHPYVHGSMVDLVKHHPHSSQVFLTTHSKSIADHCEPSQVFLVSKENGRSVFKRADSDGEIEYFCKRYGIGEAWLRGLVDAVP